MSDNPYDSPSAASPPPRTQSTRWLVWSGVSCLGLAGLCLILTVVGMLASFQRIAESTTTPSPEDLASGIRLALIPSFAALPLGIIGIGLLIAGLIIRRPGE